MSTSQSILTPEVVVVVPSTAVAVEVVEVITTAAIVAPIVSESEQHAQSPPLSPYSPREGQATMMMDCARPTIVASPADPLEVSLTAPPSPSPRDDDMQNTCASDDDNSEARSDGEEQKTTALIEIDPSATCEAIAGDDEQAVTSIRHEEDEYVVHRDNELANVEELLSLEATILAAEREMFILTHIVSNSDAFALLRRVFNVWEQRATVLKAVKKYERRVSVELEIEEQLRSISSAGSPLVRTTGAAVAASHDGNEAMESPPFHRGAEGDEEVAASFATEFVVDGLMEAARPSEIEAVAIAEEGAQLGDDDDEDEGEAVQSALSPEHDEGAESTVHALNTSQVTDAIASMMAYIESEVPLDASVLPKHNETLGVCDEERQVASPIIVDSSEVVIDALYPDEHPEDDDAFAGYRQRCRAESNPLSYAGSAHDDYYNQTCVSIHGHCYPHRDDDDDVYAGDDYLPHRSASERSSAVHTSAQTSLAASRTSSFASAVRARLNGTMVDVSVIDDPQDRALLSRVKALNQTLSDQSEDKATLRKIRYYASRARFYMEALSARREERRSRPEHHHHGDEEGSDAFGNTYRDDGDENMDGDGDNGCDDLSSSIGYVDAKLEALRAEIAAVEAAQQRHEKQLHYGEIIMGILRRGSQGQGQDEDADGSHRSDDGEDEHEDGDDELLRKVFVLWSRNAARHAHVTSWTFGATVVDSLAASTNGIEAPPVAENKYTTVSLSASVATADLTPSCASSPAPH